MVVIPVTQPLQARPSMHRTERTSKQSNTTSTTNKYNTRNKLAIGDKIAACYASITDYKYNRYPTYTGLYKYLYILTS